MDGKPQFVSLREIMLAYILRRIGLMIPTLFGIMLITFTIVQFAPGGPVERVLSQLQGQRDGAMSRVSGGGGDLGGGTRPSGGGGEASSRYRGAQGLSPEFIAKLEKQFGFDKPARSASPRCSGTMSGSISAAAIFAT